MNQPLVIEPRIQVYLAEMVLQIQTLQTKITAAAEIAARYHQINPGADVQLGPDFKTLIVTESK